LTLKIQEANFGRYLTFLRDRGKLELDGPIVARLSLELVRTYVDWLVNDIGNASISVWSCVSQLYQFARAVEPDSDWTWLRKYANWLNGRMERKVSVAPLLFDPRTVMHAILKELQYVDRQLHWKPHRRASRFRNALLIAIETALPMRLRNLAEIELDKHLVRNAGRWTLSFPADEMKAKRAAEWPLPEALACYLERYIAVHRKILLKGRRHTRLWISHDAQPFKPYNLLQRLTRSSKRILGRPLTTRLFRHSAATALAEKSLNGTMIATAVLAHGSPATTIRHYTHASISHAVAKHAKLIETIRRRSRSAEV
jgi:integrase